jgi:hypothetical protein
MVCDLGIPTGTQATVSMTRAASTDELAASAVARLRGMFRAGTTTVEIKSSYDLNVPDELRLLEVGRRLGQMGPAAVVNIFLDVQDLTGLHMVGQLCGLAQRSRGGLRRDAGPGGQDRAALDRQRGPPAHLPGPGARWPGRRGANRADRSPAGTLCG